MPARSTPPQTQVSPRETYDELLRLIGAGLRAELGHPVKEVPLRSPLAELDRLAKTHRLEGFLLKHREVLGLPDDLVETLKTSELSLAQYGLILAASSIELSRLFASEGVEHLIYKGHALRAQTDAWEDRRGGGDVDILVEPRHVHIADRLLRKHGYHAVYAIGPRSPLGWRFLTYRNREMTYRSDRIEVDLHWRVATEEDMLPTAQQLLLRKVFVGREGQEIPTLSPVDAWAASTFHFYLDFGILLRVLVDFVRLSRLADRDHLHLLPRHARNLLADLSAVLNQILGPDIVDTTGLPPADAHRVDLLLEMIWAQAEKRTVLKGSGTGLTRFRRNLEHLARYSSKARLIPRLIARGLVWFPETASHPRPIGMVRAWWLQLGRIRRGQFDSQV